MALNFPDAPTVGQKYPQPAVGGVPVYEWDGAKWTTIGVPVGGKTAVYTDGSTPMEAALMLFGSPVNPTDAAAKSYVDGKVSKSGDTMTGTLVAPKIVIGVSDLPSSQPHHLSVYSNTEVSEILVGQLGAYFGIHWQWNANAANGYVQFDTPSYANPIQIDGSVVALNSKSGGPVTAPTPGLHDLSTNVATTAFVNHGARISSGVDFNTVVVPGTYACQLPNANPNEPTGAGQWYVQVIIYNPTYLIQIAYSLFGDGSCYVRALLNGSWASWAPIGFAGAYVNVWTAAGGVTVSRFDSVWVINKSVGSPTPVALPLAANKTGPVLISDFKRDAGTNNIVITPDPSEKIQGNPNLTLAANGASVWLYPVPGIGYAT